jgi:hypothetical protein
MHLRLISGLVVLATLVPSPAIAENGIGQIKLGVPNANQNQERSRPALILISCSD